MGFRIMQVASFQYVRLLTSCEYSLTSMSLRMLLRAFSACKAK